MIRKLFYKVLKLIGYILLIPIVYILIALILTYIPVAEKPQDTPKDQTIYLATNGVHLDIVLPRKLIKTALLDGLRHTESEQYFAFGWGEENFYINTPTWGDLTFSTAFRAAFLKNNTLVHLTKYTRVREDWIPVAVSSEQLEALNIFLSNSFKLDDLGEKIILEKAGYSSQDDFYKAHGRYSILQTCNTWGNTGLKESGMKAALWTPFDFGVLRRYE